MILSDEPSDRKAREQRRSHRNDTLWTIFYALVTVGICIWYVLGKI